MAGTEWPRAILHVDMDAFYVNVHLLDHPEDHGSPLAVGGRPDSRGVISSASYEARRFGVRSAMPSSRALRLCPELRIVDANWSRIRECSRRIMDILGEYGELEQISVDEAYVDLYTVPDPQSLATSLPQRIKQEMNLPASVGLATSKLVAKVASDYDKPEGLTIVLPGSESVFLAPQPVRVIWGIGPRTAERLAAMGITTCGQLALADEEQLRSRFGREAGSLIRRAHGIDNRQVQAERGPAKSISQEWTFSRDVADEDKLREKLQEMAEDVASSLRKRSLIAYTVRIKLRWPDFTTFTRQQSLEVGTDEASIILRYAETLWQDNWPAGQPVRLIGLGVGSLQQVEEKQLRFNFDD
ncbi:MAG: DNA polymerase IV [Chloroflexota bacterium]